MKVAVVSSVFGSPWAGSEELWYQTSLQLLEQGHEVTASVFEISQHCEQLETFKMKGGKVLFRKRFRNGRIHTIKHKFISAFKSLFNGKPDTLVLSLGGLGDLMLYPDLARHLSVDSKINVILVCLFNSDHTIYNQQAREFLVSICNRCKHFVFVSKHNYLLVERQLAQKLNNVSVFSSPVSYLGKYEKVSWPQQNETLQMACVARLDVTAKG